MSEYLISVIVPVYNIEKHIEKCINSVLNQTYQNLEIVLVDDGSTDDSAPICDRLAQNDCRIQVVHKKNGGLSSARNTGLDICRGDYIGFVDGDDYVAPEMFRELLDTAVKYPDRLAITGMLDEDEDENYRKVKHEKKDLSTIEFIRELLLFRGDASVCSKLFPRSVIGDWRFAENRLNEDVLFVIQICSKINGVSFTEVNGYHYVKHQGSTSRSFGKSVHDMVLNSRDIRSYVEGMYPLLKEEAKSFELRQNLAFLCSVPYRYDRDGDFLCREAIEFVRTHILEILSSRFLSARYKCMAVMISVDPESVPYFIYKKQRRTITGAFN